MSMHYRTNQKEDAPPYEQNAPPPPQYTDHPWQDIEDTSTLPPPPNFFREHQQFESRLNASDDSFERAQQWVRQYPLWPAQKQSLNRQAIPETPFWWGVEFQGTLTRLASSSSSFSSSSSSSHHSPSDPASSHRGHGMRDRLLGLRSTPSDKTRPQPDGSAGSGRVQWKIETPQGAQDACLVHCLPVYSPLRGSKKVTAYYELAINTIGKDDASIAIGFVAMPYPLWRLPGWNRGSVGVHGDDGRRYVNDPLGGRKFVHAFKAGDVVGLGWTCPLENSGNEDVHLFFTRNGKIEGQWDLHEQIDAETEQPGGLIGLEGAHDLYIAVGVCGKCECVVRLEPQDWLWRPEA